MTLFRVVDTSFQTEECWVRCFVDGAEMSFLWNGAPPKIGEIWEGDLQNPTAGFRLISSPSDPWDIHGDAMRLRKPVDQQGTTRLQLLRKRHEIRKAVRSFLDESGFIEIDAPLLVCGTTPDIAVESFSLEDRYLASSTEYQMKRLAVGGMEKIYSLTQNFRRGDIGPYRNPEFTMLEWGRVGGSLRDIENDVEAFMACAMTALGLGATLIYQGLALDMQRPWKRETVAEAVTRITGVDISSYTPEACCAAARAVDIDIHDEWLNDRGFVFSLLMDKIQPRLGEGAPLFLTAWPAFQTTSANPIGDTFLVDRSEIFIGGIELADGFAGLADPYVQAMLFDQALATRATLGMPSVELDEKYLKAIRQGGPYGAGMALGFDRLVMLLTDQKGIASTLAFAWDEL